MNIPSLAERIKELPTDQQQQVENFIAFLESQRSSGGKTLAEKRRANRGIAQGMITMSDDFDEPLEYY